MSLPLDRPPIIVALAGRNGAGKTTFYHAHLQPAALRFINADVLAHELDLDAETAASLAQALRCQLVKLGESFVFEAVFSDPVGDKFGFLKEAAKTGYTVVVCFIGIPDLKPRNNGSPCASVKGPRCAERQTEGQISTHDGQLEGRDSRAALRCDLRQRRSPSPVPQSGGLRKRADGLSDIASPMVDRALALRLEPQ
jgi:hypothetical protein